MRGRIPVGRLLGLQLWLHPSWFPVLVAVALLTASEYRTLVPGTSTTARVAMGAVTAVAFFACLVVHEVSHSIVARRFGIRVRGITLFLFGGVAEIRGEVPHPGQEFAVALVGPLTSIALGAIFGVLAAGADALVWDQIAGVLFTLALVNLGVAVFNLIPGLPLDGGRLLRAVIWRRTGDRDRATSIASGIGKGLGIVLALSGVGMGIFGNLVGLWYVLVGVFLALLAARSRHAVPTVETGRRGSGRPGALALSGDEGPAPQPRS
ncbi:MAG: site-2 protease family protein [Actinomycetota bacterium]